MPVTSIQARGPWRADARLPLLGSRLIYLSFITCRAADASTRAHIPCNDFQEKTSCTYNSLTRHSGNGTKTTFGISAATAFVLRFNRSI